MPALATPVPTADLVDQHGDALRVCDVQFTTYGAVPAFAGPVRTVSVFNENALLHELLRSPGDGSVVVVDGGASLHSALLGDLMAERARDNGWAGLVIHGAVRDSGTLAGVQVGIQALGTNPRKSGKTGAGAVDVPVGFGGIVFRPGDVLHADRDGVVLLPAG